MNIKERFKLFKTYLESISGSHKTYVKPLSQLARYVLEAETGEQVVEDPTENTPNQAETVKQPTEVTEPDENGVWDPSETPIPTIIGLPAFISKVTDYLTKNPGNLTLSSDLLADAKMVCTKIELLIEQVENLDEEEDADTIRSLNMGDAFELVKQMPSLDNKKRLIKRAINELAANNQFISSTNYRETTEQLRKKSADLHSELETVNEMDKPFDDIKSKLTVLANKISAANHKYAIADYSTRMSNFNQANAKAKSMQKKNSKEEDDTVKEPENDTAKETENDTISAAPQNDEVKNIAAETTRTAEDAVRPEEAAARELFEKMVDESDDDSPIDLVNLLPHFQEFVSTFRRLASMFKQSDKPDIPTSDGLALPDLTSKASADIYALAKVLNGPVFKSDNRDAIKRISCENVIQQLNSLLMPDKSIKKLYKNLGEINQTIKSGVDRSIERPLRVKAQVYKNISDADGYVERMIDACNRINQFKMQISKMPPLAKRFKESDNRIIGSIDDAQLIPDMQNQFAKFSAFTQKDAEAIKTLYIAVQNAKKAKSTDLSSYLPEGFNMAQYKNAENGGFMYTIGNIAIPLRVAYEMSLPADTGVTTSIQNDNQFVIMEHYTVGDRVTSKWNVVLSVDVDNIGVTATYTGKTSTGNVNKATRINKMEATIDDVFDAVFTMLTDIVPAVKY